MLNNFSEAPIVFRCEGMECVGVLSLPAPRIARKDVAVIIVVGGPQYRVGSHRQFVLLARHLASVGVVTFRFDYRGMGDSEGPARDFEQIDEDLECVVDLVCERAGVTRVILWGLCDGASASMMYAARDRRIAGLVCANPWVRSPEGLAKARLKHYYLARFFGKEFWSKLFSGGVSLRGSASELLRFILQARAGRDASSTGQVRIGQSFLQRMDAGWRSFTGPMLFLLCRKDLTANEFSEWVRADRRRRSLFASDNTRVARHAEADHTFSAEAWRRWAEDSTSQWIASHFPTP